MPGMQALTAKFVAACLAACAGLAHGAPEPATLPGVRPVRADLPGAAAAVASVPAPVPAAVRIPRPGDLAVASGLAAASAAADDPSAAAAPARSCEEALHLPWGPIDSCRSAVVAGAVGTSAALSALAWWDQGLGSSFSTASEGWFGKGTYAGGIDKLGHAYSFYLATRLGTRALAWARVPQDEALRLAAALSLGFGLGVEVFDGLSRSGRYGFSWEDLTMNLVGIGLAMWMEADPRVDRSLAFRVMYSPAGRRDSWYDHQTYLLAFRLSGLTAIGRDNPLRYLEVVAGYGAKGFRSDFDYSQEDLRQRTAYVGIALNLTELLDRTVFSGSARNGRAHRWATETLRYVQPPGTAIGFRKRWTP